MEYIIRRLIFSTDYGVLRSCATTPPINITALRNLHLSAVRIRSRNIVFVAFFLSAYLFFFSSLFVVLVGFLTGQPRSDTKDNQQPHDGNRRRRPEHKVVLSGPNTNIGPYLPPTDSLGN